MPRTGSRARPTWRSARRGVAPQGRARRPRRAHRHRDGGAQRPPGRWTFQIVEEFDDGYYADFKALEELVGNQLMGGRRHVYEAEMKADRRTPGPAPGTRPPLTTWPEPPRHPARGRLRPHWGGCEVAAYPVVWAHDTTRLPRQPRADQPPAGCWPTSSTRSGPASRWPCAPTTSRPGASGRALRLHLVVAGGRARDDVPALRLCECTRSALPPRGRRAEDRDPGPDVPRPVLGGPRQRRGRATSTSPEMAGPDKEVRTQRLEECVDVIRRMLHGEEVSHDGLVTVDRAACGSCPTPCPSWSAPRCPSRRRAGGRVGRRPGDRQPAGRGAAPDHRGLPRRRRPRPAGPPGAPLLGPTRRRSPRA